MAELKWDLAGCTAIERDMPLVADTYELGEILCDGVTDGTDVSLLKSGEGVYNYFAGILCDDGITTTGTLAANTIEYARVTVNPFGVYECPIYAPAASIAVAAVSSGTSDFTFTCGSSKGHPNLGGGWIYGTTDPNAGSLVQIKSSAVSSTTCTVTVHTAQTANWTTSSKFALIYPAGRYMVDLTTTGIDGTDLDSGGGTAGTDGMAVRIIENHIKYTGYPKQILKGTFADTNQTLDALSVKFWSYVSFAASASYLV